MKGLRTQRRREARLGLAMVAPAVLPLLVFFVAPSVFVAVISLYNWSLLGDSPAFTGADNYIRLLHDDRFWQAFRQTGLSAPPTTWAQFADYAAKLNTADTWAADFFNSSFMVSVWDAMVQAYGGKVVNDDQTAVAFNSQAGGDALRFWVELAQKQQIRVSSEPNAGQLNFGAGKTALYVSDSSALSFIKQAVGDKFEIGAAPMPAGPAGAFSELGSANICLFNRAPKNVQAAGFRVITYLLSSSVNGAFVNAGNHLPNRISTVNELKSFYVENPIPATAVAQMDHAVDPPTVQSWPQIASAVLVHLLAAVRGDESVEDALSKAEKEANEILKK